MEGQVIAFVFYGSGTFEINYNVTLSKGASDCISCVIKGTNFMWNTDTYCSAKSTGYNSVNQCIENGLFPQQKQLMTVDATLNY